MLLKRINVQKEQRVEGQKLLKGQKFLEEQIVSKIFPFDLFLVRFILTTQ